MAPKSPASQAIQNGLGPVALWRAASSEVGYMSPSIEHGADTLLLPLAICHSPLTDVLSGKPPALVPLQVSPVFFPHASSTLGALAFAGCMVVPSFVMGEGEGAGDWEGAGAGSRESVAVLKFTEPLWTS